MDATTTARGEAVVGCQEELAHLEQTYANPTIRKKIRTLALIYPHWRSIRGDGNCFYRALWVGLVEEALRRNAEVDAVLSALRARFEEAERALAQSHGEEGNGQGTGMYETATCSEGAAQADSAEM